MGGGTWVLNFSFLDDYVKKIFWYYATYVFGGVVALVLTLLLSKTARLNDLAVIAKCSPSTMRKGNNKKKNKKQTQRTPKSFFESLLALLQPNKKKGLRISALLISWVGACATVYLLHEKVTPLRLQEWTGVQGTFPLLIFVIISLPVFINLGWVFIVRQNLGVSLDLLVLQGCAPFAFGKFGCMILGCCYGVPASWGFHREEVTVFPVQLFEALNYVLILAVAVWFICKSKHYLPGRACSVTMIGFAISRFGWEFLRASSKVGDEAGWFGLRTFQIVSLLMIVVAVVWWFVVPKLTQWQKAADASIFGRLEQKRSR